MWFNMWLYHDLPITDFNTFHSYSHGKKTSKQVNYSRYWYDLNMKKDVIYVESMN